jgi:hypothetical protein
MPELSAYRHHLGVHCASAALRNVHHHYTGERWSEAMCFGLAAGLNFTYVREFQSPFYLVMGRGSAMENHFCDALGIRLEVCHSDDAELAWQHLRGQLDRGELVMIDADMFELPYMIQRLNLVGGVHFGGHKALVTGYDAQGGTVQLADYAWHARRSVTVAQLKAARDSRRCPSRPRNASFRFHYPGRLPPQRHALATALATMVNQMRYPFREFNGLPAIARFCRQVPKWGLAMSPDELRLNCSLAAFMFEKAGTGGGAFRNLYSRFLDEAAQVLEAPVLTQAAALYRTLAGQWREVAALLEQAGADPGRGMYAPGNAAQLLMAEIGDNEVRGVELVSDYLQHARAGEA